MVANGKLYKIGLVSLNNIVWIILFMCLIVFSFTIDGFSSIRNFTNIVYHSVFIGILAIAESYCLISGNMDLSIESVAALSAVISAYLSATSPLASGLHLNPFLSLVIVVMIGAFVGLFNAFFILKLKINAFLVTLSTYIAVRGLALLIAAGKGISQLPDSFRYVDTIKILGMPLMVYLMIILFIIFFFVLENTKFGRHTFIIGGNIYAAYNFGINVNNILLKIFIMSGAISGLVGWLIAARVNGATPGIASGYLFEVLAAVIIGGVSFSGGVGSLIGVFAGVLLLSSIHSALNMLAISPYYTDLIRGGLILVAITLDSIKRIYKR